MEDHQQDQGAVNDVVEEVKEVVQEVQDVQKNQLITVENEQG